jgi:hypothetical protein
MHLFIVDQYPDLDEFAPIMHEISSNSEIKAAMMNIYPIQDITKYELTNLLINKSKIKIINLSSINIKNLLIIACLKVILLLPKYILFRLNRLWFFLYHKMNFLNVADLKRLIKKKKILSISINAGLALRYKKIFFEACSETNIKLLLYSSSVEMRKNFNVPDYIELYSHHIIISDQASSRNKEYDKVRNKIINLNSARYSFQWLNTLEDINIYKIKNYRIPLEAKDKIKIVIFTRSLFHKEEWKNIESKIRLIPNVDVKLRYKPRGDLSPLNINRQYANQNSSSELINWADIVISHKSAILIEAMMKKKVIFFPQYLLQDKRYMKIKKDLKFEKYLFEDFSCVININSLSEMLTNIENSLSKIEIWNKTCFKGQQNFLKEIFGDDFFEKKNY